MVFVHLRRQAALISSESHQPQGLGFYNSRWHHAPFGLGAECIELGPEALESIPRALLNLFELIGHDLPGTLIEGVCVIDSPLILAAV